MKHKTNQFAAFVGIDWADQKHDVSVSSDNDAPVHQVIPHTPEDLTEWLGDLHQHSHSRYECKLLNLGTRAAILA